MGASLLALAKSIYYYLCLYEKRTLNDWNLNGILWCYHSCEMLLPIQNIILKLQTHLNTQTFFACSDFAFFCFSAK